MRLVPFTLYLSLGALVGCGRSGGERSVSEPAASPLPQTSMRSAPPNRVSRPEYALSLEQLPAEGTEAPHSAAGVLLALKARAPYHINRDYPIRVVFEAPPEVAVEPAQLAAKDALMTDTAVEFRAHTRVAAGSPVLRARVDFAVCTAERCLTDERTLTLALHGDLQGKDAAAGRPAASKSQVPHAK